MLKNIRCAPEEYDNAERLRQNDPTVVPAVLSTYDEYRASQATLDGTRQRRGQVQAAITKVAVAAKKSGAKPDATELAELRKEIASLKGEIKKLEVVCNDKKDELDMLVSKVGNCVTEDMTSFALNLQPCGSVSTTQQQNVEAVVSFLKQRKIIDSSISNKAAIMSYVLKTLKQHNYHDDTSIRNLPFHKKENKDTSNNSSPLCGFDFFADLHVPDKLMPVNYFSLDSNGRLKLLSLAERGDNAEGVKAIVSNLHDVFSKVNLSFEITLVDAPAMNKDAVVEYELSGDISGSVRYTTDFNTIKSNVHAGYKKLNVDDGTFAFAVEGALNVNIADGAGYTANMFFTLLNDYFHDNSYVDPIGYTFTEDDLKLQTLVEKIGDSQDFRFLTRWMKMLTRLKPRNNNITNE